MIGGVACVGGRGRSPAGGCRCTELSDGGRRLCHPGGRRAADANLQHDPDLKVENPNGIKNRLCFVSDGTKILLQQKQNICVDPHSLKDDRFKTHSDENGGFNDVYKEN